MGARYGLAQRPPSIPELQQLAEATQIGEPASSSAEVRQLVDHLSEQAREVASEASMERTPRALAMWMAGLTLAFAISIALAQKVRGYTVYEYEPGISGKRDTTQEELLPPRSLVRKKKVE